MSDWKKCKTHGDIDGDHAWGCPDCVSELRADNGRLTRELAEAKETSAQLQFEIDDVTCDGHHEILKAKLASAEAALAKHAHYEPNEEIMRQADQIIEMCERLEKAESALKAAEENAKPWSSQRVAQIEDLERRLARAAEAFTQLGKYSGSGGVLCFCDFFSSQHTDYPQDYHSRECEDATEALAALRSDSDSRSTQSQSVEPPVKSPEEGGVS